MRFPKVPRLDGARCTLLAVLLVFAAGSVRSQGLPGLSPDMQEALQQATQRGSSLQDVLKGEAVPMEGALDPEAYLVGPGDVFEIAVNTALPTAFNITVTADGLLVVPSAGSFEVAGLTLAEARTRVLAGLRRAYRNVGASVALARPRQFYVHVAGTVIEPGRHVVAPVARVEDALTEAMGGASPVLVLRELREAASSASEPPFYPALRSIEIRRRDSTTVQVDLWRYYTSGDLAFNPYVRDGDAIFVPAFRDDLGEVAVSGQVPNPGTYDYRADDTVDDLLQIALGSNNFERLEEVRVARRQGVLTLSASDLASGRASEIALAPGDRIIIAPSDRGSGVANVDGYVEYPGSYPISAGETTLRELVEMAGGVRDNALLRGAYLERRGTARSAIYEPEQTVPFRPPTIQPGVDSRAVELAIEAEVSAASRNSDLGFAGQRYYGSELMQPQRVSVDVAASLSGAAPPVFLRDGDRLVIPRDPNAVLVVGQVGRPGYVPFQQGLSAGDYVALAGGEGSTATKVYVRDASTGRIRPATGAAVGSGDYVFVDREGVGDMPTTQALVIQEQALEVQEENVAIQRTNRYYQLVAAAITSAAIIITTLITK